jgi:Tfp pilus assembly protein PilF
MPARIQLLNQALELDPSSDRAYYNRGTMYMEQQDCQSAIADFDQALALNPKRVFAYARAATLDDGKRLPGQG